MERNAEVDAIVAERLKWNYGPNWRERFVGELTPPTGHPAGQPWRPSIHGRQACYDDAAQEWICYRYDVWGKWRLKRRYYGPKCTVEVYWYVDLDNRETLAWYVAPFVSRKYRPRYFP